MDNEVFCMRIDTDYCGGNLKILSQDGDTFYVAPDLRDTEGDWFYFNFRVIGAEGRTLKFDFQKRAVPPFGPAVSFDGENWEYLPHRFVREENDFTFTFKKGENKVYFAFSFQYQAARMAKYLAAHPNIGYRILCLSEKGRAVPVLTVGNGPVRLAFSCRHHSCEAVASYVLEGILDAFSSDPAFGQKYSVLALPFVDIDGVEDGDQGKNRRPHDHNRDYIPEPVYASVKAWMKEVNHFCPAVAIDLHDPYMWGWENDHTFFTYCADEEKLLDKLSEIFSRTTAKSVLKHDPSYDLRWNTKWNCAEEGQETSANHFYHTFGAKIGTSLEIPYFGTACPVADDFKKLGKDLLDALDECLHGAPEN